MNRLGLVKIRQRKYAKENAALEDSALSAALRLIEKT